MTWNSASPDGALSVKDNRTPMNQNTTYLEVTLGKTANDIAYATSQKDHYFAVSSNLDGHHRFIKMPAYTVGGVASNPGPALGTGISGIQYNRTVSATEPRVEIFYRNANGIYQLSPSFTEGTHLVTSSYTDLGGLTLPANVYGEIAMYTTTDDGSTSGAFGHFSSIFVGGTVLYAWSFTQSTNSSGSSVPLKFGNGSSASGLKIRVRTSDATSNLTWNYRVTWRGI